MGRAKAGSVAGFLVLLVISSPAWAALSFQGLGSSAIVYDVANDGAVVVGRINNTSAGVWKPGIGWTNLGFEGFAYKSARDGSAVAGFIGASTSTLYGNEAFRWTPAGGVQHLGYLPGGDGSQMLGISGDGNTLVGASSATGSARVAMRWSQPTGMVSFATLLGNPYESQSRGASYDRSIIVGDVQQTTNFNTYKTWKWNASTNAITYLTGLGSAWAVSGDGNVVVGTTPGVGPKAARWTVATGAALLGSVGPNDTSSEARDVSADGSIITGYAYPDGNTQTAFIWDSAHGMRSLKDVLTNDYGLNLSGWKLSWAYVSDDGKTFGGWGVDPANFAESWVATVPEPTTATLLIAPAFVALPRRRRAAAP